MQKRSIAEILTGLVVLAVAASFLGYAVTSTGRSFSGPGMNLTAKFDRIDGLGQGADVRIAGVKVGQNPTEAGALMAEIVAGLR